jgi:hypothetical protein
MNAAAKTAAQRSVDLDAQNCFAGEPLLLKTRNDIFFRITQALSFLESEKKKPLGCITPRGLLCVIGNPAVLSFIQRR